MRVAVEDRSIRLPFMPDLHTIDVLVAKAPRHVAVDELGHGVAVVFGDPMERQPAAFGVDIGPFPDGSDAFGAGLLYVAGSPHGLFRLAARGIGCAHGIDVGRVGIARQSLRRLNALLGLSTDTSRFRFA